MLSSASENRNRWMAAMAAAAGTGAYAFPLLVPWHVLLLVVSTLAGMAHCRTPEIRTVWLVFCSLILIAVLGGHLPSPLSASIVSASVLSMMGSPAMAVAVLLMNITFVPTLQERVAILLHWAGLEAAGPALIAIALLLLARPHFALRAVVAAGVSVFATLMAKHMALMPESAMAIAALPACGLAALMVLNEFATRENSFLVVATTLLLGLISWTWTQPRSWDETYVLLPEAPTAFEAKFFKNYLEALGFAGINAKQVQPEDIPINSLVLLPWSTSPLTTEVGDPLATKIGELARERYWTVLVTGEHTNLGGAAHRIEAMSGQSLLRDDLTVPPGNTDNSGPLHIADLRPWPHESVLNRGASVLSGTYSERVLLAGDGWWAEPDVGEWLWVGDYVWRPGERAGRLTLASSFDIGNARWVIVGDNGPFLNSQLIADPRPAIRLLELATLWPAFLKDLIIVAMVCLICVPISDPSWRDWKPSVGVASLVAIAVLGHLTLGRESITWRDTYVGQSAFDERNFNVMLAKNPALIKGHRLIRLEQMVSGPVMLPEENALIFMLVNGEAEIGGVKLSQCRRIGALATSEGPFLMDAESCRVEGPAQILIGTAENAAAFSVTNKGSTAIVLLDTAFLGQKAPDKNAEWLLENLPR